jgi:hypothetical protein
MMCPRCVTTQLIFQNASYFCPNCKIYIGSINAVKEISEKSNPYSFKAINEELITPKIIMRTKIISFALLAIIVIIVFYILNLSSYIDIVDFCKIEINSKFLSGNSETIKQAISILKNKNNFSYKTLCSYVNNITEEYCVAGDINIKPELTKDYSNKGCFIKGTHTVYLLPKKENTTNIAEERAETLSKYAQFSKDYWTKNN